MGAPAPDSELPNERWRSLDLPGAGSKAAVVASGGTASWGDSRYLLDRSDGLRTVVVLLELPVSSGSGAARLTAGASPVRGASGCAPCASRSSARAETARADSWTPWLTATPGAHGQGGQAPTHRRCPSAVGHRRAGVPWEPSRHPCAELPAALHARRDRPGGLPKGEATEAPTSAPQGQPAAVTITSPTSTCHNTPPKGDPPTRTANVDACPEPAASAQGLDRDPDLLEGNSERISSGSDG